MRIFATSATGASEHRLIRLQETKNAVAEADWKKEWIAQYGRESVPEELAASVEAGQASARSHIGQLLEDTRRYHLRADGTLETVGAVPMAVGAGVGKIGNAAVGDIANFFRGKKGQERIQPIPLGEGNFKYIRRDIASLADNTIDFGKNVITLHPLRALGSGAKGLADAFDLVTADPLLDGGSAFFGHAYERRGRTILSQNADTRERIATLQRKASVSDHPFSNN